MKNLSADDRIKFLDARIDRANSQQEVEDMYDYVQESVTDTAKKSSYENKLEFYFTELNKLQEHMMSHKTKRMMNEEDVTLKLTGLPDDIDLDSVGVDLITGEEDEDGDENLDLDSNSGDDMDIDGLCLSKSPTTAH